MEKEQFGKCRACGGTYRLTSKGNVSTHYLYAGAEKSELPCTGTLTSPSRKSSRLKRQPRPKAIVLSGKAQAYADIKGIDLEGVIALQRSYDIARRGGLRYVTYDRLIQENALVLATKGRYKIIHD